ncbi:MAG: hypothetical protein JKY09_08425 [Crocinitomicaceae bacterium]|nr:hypothetical protein [Crocinitomicaceae bacterium]
MKNNNYTNDLKEIKSGLHELSLSFTSVTFSTSIRYGMVVYNTLQLIEKVKGDNKAFNHLYNRLKILHLSCFRMDEKARAEFKQLEKMFDNLVIQ